jgi:hypothetical protein
MASTLPTLYILAQEYKIKDLTDAGMDYIGNCYALTDTLPSRAEIHQVLDKSPLGSKLRKYMTMACLYILSSPSYTTGVENVLPTADLWFLGIHSIQDMVSYVSIIVTTQIFHFRPEENVLNTP